MDVYEAFTEWAIAEGVKLNGIRTHRFPGRRLGIIAEKKHEAGDTILDIPRSALRTVQTVPKSISIPIGTITVQGLLAAELAMDTSEVRAPWRAILPAKEDFEESMPLMWHPSLQALLPPASLSLLENQRKKLSSDWGAVSTAFPALSYDHYLYNWFMVSTRTFYYTSPGMKTQKPVNHDDCLAITPFADYFNHADMGCEVTFSAEGYKICTDRRVDKGEEIFISYGNHSNDFLLAEYGFILDENKWDQISLDEVVLPFFSPHQTQTLKEAGFLGNYVLDKETTCYRTQAALKLLCMPANRWECLVVNGVLEDDAKTQVAMNQICLKVLNAHLDSARMRLNQVKALDCGLASQRDMLSKRWEQICLLLTTAIGRLET
ncbi:MAG: hypothetical protein M1818_003687 [Claussenomyces sp. TS43310]|nr:MAG: hypothetical protein M1818_003687 [Claussenomyces sp. TS43310]